MINFTGTPNYGGELVTECPIPWETVICCASSFFLRAWRSDTKMRSISLLASASALDYRAYKGIANTRLNENCPDLDKADVCEKECISDVKDCAEGCGSGKDCLNACNRDLISCIDGCPCHTDCLDGCLNCMSPVCGCNVSIVLFLKS